MPPIPKKLFLYLLLEHKSYADPLAVFQLLRYMVRIWEKHCTEHPKEVKLPPVYPMIIYHGVRPWRHPVNFHSLFTIQELVTGAGHPRGPETPWLFFPAGRPGYPGRGVGTDSAPHSEACFSR